MEWEIPKDERTYLRGLAAQQAQYAALPVMAQRKQMWYDLNDSRPGARPPMIVETWTFDRDFLPESVFRCQSAAGRTVERQLLRNLRNHELIDDDKVMPDAFEYGWFTDISEFGFKIGRTTAKDAQGVETAYHYQHPIQDLRRDLSLLKPVACRVDRERTAAWRAFLEELFAGALPVRLSTGFFGQTFLTNRVIELMGMEAFFLAMYDCPDQLHALMAYLRDNCLRMMRWAEDEALLRVNNGNQTSFGSSYNFTTRLPKDRETVGPEDRKTVKPKEGEGHKIGSASSRSHGIPVSGPTDLPARMRDMFGSSNSQETVGVSPALFHEFCFPYYRDSVAPLGLLYYGCCEPAHPFWDDIRALPHLKKVSISRWCDEPFMADALRGTGIVYSRKPDPNFLSVDEKLNEDAWAAHIRKTLEVTRGVFVEFIVRDVYTVHGDLNNPRRAVEIARREIDRVCP